MTASGACFAPMCHCSAVEVPEKILVAFGWLESFRGRTIAYYLYQRTSVYRMEVYEELDSRRYYTIRNKTSPSHDRFRLPHAVSSMVAIQRLTSNWNIPIGVIGWGLMTGGADTHE